MEYMSLPNRFVGSILDKFFILFTFIGVGICVSPFGFSSYLGMVVGILNERHTTPIALDNLNFIMYGVFILVNLCYYLLFELACKATPGKYIMGGLLINKQNKTVSLLDCIWRITIFTILIVVAICLQYSLNLSYAKTILLFFYVIDVSVFLYKASLVDLATDTKYIKRSYYTPLNTKQGYK